MPIVNGKYSMNGQVARGMGQRAEADGDTRATPEEAGYMELDGAQKDGDCSLVSGGVSSAMGCCNLFDPQGGAQAFSCGNCTKMKAGMGGEDKDQDADMDQAQDTDSAMAAMPQAAGTIQQ